MMKKILFTFISICMLGASSNAQDTPSDKQNEFDKKFRFGIRATPQPTWFKSDNVNSKAAGANFGFGFGLMMEFKLSKIVHFSTGIGGDFEGGYINYRNEADFSVNAVINSEGQYVESNKGVITDEIKFANGNTQVVLKDRQYKSTFVTIPLILKMMTEEYGGARYFALFGGELGIRAGLKANDSYVSGIKSTVSGTTTTTAFVSDADLSKTKIDISKDGSLVPMRLGMNLGMGTEYRLGGSTSVVFSLNYFQSFTNLMKKDSKYLVKATNTDSNELNQGYFMRAIRINIGLLF
jgi:hypothetical protein